jgi:RimJ/RimL family protein N-acetyltransferase
VTDVAALFGLRVTTPRLTLRVGTTGEVRALGELAQRGIHAPEEMPFGVAWSDRTALPGFLEEFATFHRKALTGWTADRWHLNLLVWEHGILVGTQGLGAERPGEQRLVSTGSWLGRNAQGRGIGTEMRAAVLELAFRGLGAEAAASGWLEGNAASGRVSEKLGYRNTGVSEVSPRGTPVPHHDVRIERADWRSPVAVEISGLENCLALFGAAQPIERNAAASD